MLASTKTYCRNVYSGASFIMIYRCCDQNMKGCANINRTYHEIIAEILQVVKTWEFSRPFKVQSRECRFHHISYSIGQPWTMTRKYLNLLLGQKLLISSDTGPNQHYEITPEGIRFLEIFTEIEDDIKPVSH